MHFAALIGAALILAARAGFVTTAITDPASVAVTANGWTVVGDGSGTAHLLDGDGNVVDTHAFGVSGVVSVVNIECLTDHVQLDIAFVSSVAKLFNVSSGSFAQVGTDLGSIRCNFAVQCVGDFLYTLDVCLADSIQIMDHPYTTVSTFTIGDHMGWMQRNPLADELWVIETSGIGLRIYEADGVTGTLTYTEFRSDVTIPGFDPDEASSFVVRSDGSVVGHGFSSPNVLRVYDSALTTATDYTLDGSTSGFGSFFPVCNIELLRKDYVVTNSDIVIFCVDKVLRIKEDLTAGFEVVAAGDTAVNSVSFSLENSSANPHIGSYFNNYIAFADRDTDLVYSDASDPILTESATQSMTPTQSQTASATESAAPGSVGDPILVDFAGHRFMGGARGRTKYLLYRSHDETEAITMTTGVEHGAEEGFFAVTIEVQRAGCGSLRIAAAPEHTAEISGDACMTARIARGDEGLVMVPIGEGGDAGSVLAVYPHQHGDTPAFLNMRLLATTPAFRAGCTGMLCNEAHGDVEA